METDTANRSDNTGVAKLPAKVVKRRLLKGQRVFQKGRYLSEC